MRVRTVHDGVNLPMSHWLFQSEVRNFWLRNGGKSSTLTWISASVKPNDNNDYHTWECSDDKLAMFLKLRFGG